MFEVFTKLDGAGLGLGEYDNGLSSLISNVNIGIFRSTPVGGRFLNLNPAMARIFGYDSVDDLMGVETVALYRNGADRNSLVEELNRSGSMKNMDVPMKKKDGSPIWCSMTITAVRDEQGELRWLDGVVEDITERKTIQLTQQAAIEELETRVRERLADLVDANRRLEAEVFERRLVEYKLRENNAFLEVLINAIPSPVFYKGKDGVYQGCNTSFEKYMGVSREKLVGKTDFDITSREEAEKFVGIDRAVMENPGVEDYETSLFDASGRQRNLIIIKTAFQKDGEVGGVIGIMVDVTDLKRLEEEQQKVEKLESLGVLAGGIAHDFNNIITGILGNISLARIHIDPSHRASRQLEAAEKASQRASDLASQLLTFAKGGAPIKKRISLGNVVNETVSFMLRGSNIHTSIEIPESLCSIEADEGQLSQAFGNIMLNAMQAMSDGGALRITAEDVLLDEWSGMALPPGPYAKISFADQGCGIAEENRLKIFDPYFTTKTGGTGLGLSTTYSIIKKHGGHIELISKPGVGTTFTCYLPSSGESSITESPGKKPAITGAVRSGNILVMDDEEMIRRITTEILDFLGYKAITCARGEDAIRLYREAMDSGDRFVAVIMDLTVPGGMGGKEAAGQILEIDPHARLIVSSGYSNNRVIADYKKYGFCATVLKPYEAKDISEVLDRVLALPD